MSKKKGIRTFAPQITPSRLAISQKHVRPSEDEFIPPPIRHPPPPTIIILCNAGLGVRKTTPAYPSLPNISALIRAKYR